LVADIYSPEHRGRAIGLVQAGTPLGSVTAMLAGGWLLTWFESTGTLVNSGLGLKSWQGVFLILGIPGLVLAALLMGVREPARRGLSAKMSPTRWIGKKGLFGESGWALASILLLHSLLGIEAYAILAWMPSILVGSYGRSAAAAGSITAPMIVIGGFGAYILSGVCSDSLNRWRPHYGRIFLPAVVIPLAIIAMVWNCLDSSIVSLTTGMSIALFTGALVSAADVPAFQAIVPGRLRGQAMGIFTLVSNLLGLGVGPTLVAAIAEHLFGKDGLRQALIAVCWATLIAALAIWPIVRSTYARARKFEIEELE
jgi:MFS family permease